MPSGATRASGSSPGPPPSGRARGQAGNRPVLLVDGVVAGVWHHRRAGRRIDITVEPLTTLTAARRRLLDAEVERLGAILEGAVEARVGAVTVGPHA